MNQPDRGRVRFGQERDIGGVISTTFEFLRETWRELGLGLLYVAGPALVLTAAGSYFLQSRLFGMMEELNNVDPDDPGAVFGSLGSLVRPSYVVTILGGLIAGVLVTAVVYGYLRLYREGRAGSIPPGALWNEASHLLGRSAKLWLVVAAVLTVCVAGIVVFCLGFVALIALTPALALFCPAVMLGSGSIRDGLGEAWRLSARAWLPTLGVMVVSAIIWYVINAALTLPASIAGMMLGLNSADPSFEISGTMRVLLAIGTVLGAFGYLFYAIPLVAGALQYFSIAVGEAGGGLDERVAALEGTATGDEPAIGSAPPPLPPPDSGPAAGGYRGRGFDDG